MNRIFQIFVAYFLCPFAFATNPRAHGYNMDLLNSAFCSFHQATVKSFIFNWVHKSSCLTLALYTNQKPMPLVFNNMQYYVTGFRHIFDTKFCLSLFLMGSHKVLSWYKDTLTLSLLIRKVSIILLLLLDLLHSNTT